MSIELAPAVEIDSKPTVNELSVALKKITEWKTFAVSLSQRIEPHHITEIQANESTISEKKLALYMKWLQVCPDAKWSDVVTALRAIDEHALADTLTGSTGGTSHTHSTTDTPIEEGATRETHPTADTLLHFPATSEEEEVIKQQLTKLHDSFTILLQDVRTHIEGVVGDQSTGFNKLCDIAANLEDANLDDRLANLTECKSFAELWKKLRNVCKFFDGSILNGIVRFSRLHDKALESRTEEHMRKAHTLMLETPLKILRDNFKTNKCPKPFEVTVTIQLNEYWHNHPLKLVKQVLQHLCDGKETNMIVIDIRSGSIEINFLVSDSIKKELGIVTSQKAHFMHLVGVFGLTLENDSIFQERKNNTYTFEQGLLEASVTGHLQAVQFILCLQVNMCPFMQ